MLTKPVMLLYKRIFLLILLAEALADKGMKIMKPPPKLMADLKQVGAIMLADWQKKAGADGAAVVNAYRKK